ncbi:MAG: hypothetical protein NTV49_15710 [Kiritimatiellaeota bacterium]|nr:hypothetical protein [Kiritimatiellota bacterium]
MKVAFYIFRVLSYAAGTGALALYLSGKASAVAWVYVLAILSFVCFVVTWFFMIWLRLRR